MTRTQRKDKDIMAVDEVTLRAGVRYAREYGEGWQRRLVASWNRGDVNLDGILYGARNRYGAVVILAVEAALKAEVSQ